jgi:hypothetical protein
VSEECTDRMSVTVYIGVTTSAFAATLHSRIACVPGRFFTHVVAPAAP